MAIACKICIAQRGLRGSDLNSLPQDEEELVKHMESVHHMPVIREGETEEQAEARFIKEHPEALSCSECIEAGAHWIGGKS
jgi:hypothetical protein